MTRGDAALLAVEELEMELSEPGVLLSALPASLAPPQPASATLKATTSRTAPRHLPIVRLLPVRLLPLMSLPLSLEVKTFKALR